MSMWGVFSCVFGRGCLLWLYVLRLSIQCEILKCFEILETLNIFVNRFSENYLPTSFNPWTTAERVPYLSGFSEHFWNSYGVFKSERWWKEESESVRWPAYKGHVAGSADVRIHWPCRALGPCFPSTSQQTCVIAIGHSDFQMARWGA